MIGNEVITGVITIVIAYLLGSIPSAYIVTRLATGKDIRKLGGGNVGARNVFREIGWKAAIPVLIFDVGKGAAAVAIAIFWLDTSLYFVLGAGVAAVAGHIWSVYLKFSGGNGLSPTLGVLAVLMQQELLIALAITLLFIVITRNPVLSLNISLLSLPVSAWLLGKSWIPVVFTTALIAIMVINFIPTARAALAKAGTRENLFADLLRKKKPKNEKR